MPWSARITENVASGADSQRFDLKPGEVAHVQVEYVTPGADVLGIWVLTTNEDSPGVAQLDQAPVLEMKLTAAAPSISFPVAGFHAFVLRVFNDSGAGALTCAVRVRRDDVDLTVNPA